MTTLLAVSLNELEAFDLVRAMPETDPAYQFKHALVQDTALLSLLNQERKRLHLLVAESLEHLYGDELDDIAVRLYQHYDAAGERQKAITYAERAGNAAARKSAYAEAIIAYSRALMLTEQQPEDSGALIRLMTRLGRTYEEDFKYDTAIALYQRMRELAQTRADRPLELAALVQLAKIYAVAAMRYNPEQSAQISEQALALAHALGDRHAEARVYWAMMLANAYGSGGARQGVKYGEQSLELARALNWREQMAYTLNDLAYTYLNLGETDRALASATEAQGLWRELDNKPMLTDNLNAGAMQYVMQGKFEPALAALSESRTLAIAIGNRWGEATSFMVEGYIKQATGELTDALKAFHSCIDAGDAIGVQGPLVIACLELAHIYAWLGEPERGMVFARDALDRLTRQRVDWTAWAFAALAFAAEQNGDLKTADEAVAQFQETPLEYHWERMLPYGAFEIIRAQIRCELRHGEWDAALQHSDQALAHFRDGGFKILVPLAFDQRARTLVVRGEFDRAQTDLEKGKALARTIKLPPTQLALAQTRVELETARNNLTGRDAAISETSDLINNLLPNIPPELRASFQKTALGKYSSNAGTTTGPAQIR